MKNRLSNLALSMDLALSDACEKSAKDDMRDAGNDLKDAANAMGRAADQVVDKAVEKVPGDVQR